MLKKTIPKVDNSSLRYLIVGAGAVGGYFGGRMLQAGLAVTFLARGERLQQLESSGLQIESIDGDMDFPTVPVIASATQPVDVILLCGKSYSMPEMLDDIQPAVGTNTLIVSLQNGLGNEAYIAEQYGDNRTIGGVAFIAATRLENNVIQHTSAGRLTLGQWHQSITRELYQQMLKELATCQFELQDSPSIRDDIWKKLLWNAAFNPVCALLKLPVDQLLHQHTGRELIASIMHEIITLAWLNEVELSRDLAERTIASTAKMIDFEPSMLQDYRAGRRMELEAICLAPLASHPTALSSAPSLTAISRLLQLNSLISAQN